MKISVKIKDGKFVDSEALKMFLELNEGKGCEIIVVHGTRTAQQNRALYKFFELLATALNDAGLDMRVVLKPTYSLPWDKDLVKKHLWKPLQKIFYSTNSTKELTKIEQIDKIHAVIMRELGQKHGLEYIPFPNMEEGEVDSEGRVNIKN